MKSSTRTIGGPEILILAGCSIFIFILWLSAYFEADIRWLHFFQAWMYLATIVLALRRNRWGYFIGLSAAGLWDYINLFVTTFFRNGLHWLHASITGGHLQQVDQIIAVPAWAGCVALSLLVGTAAAPRRVFFPAPSQRVCSGLHALQLRHGLTTVHLVRVVRTRGPLHALVELFTVSKHHA